MSKEPPSLGLILRRLNPVLTSNVRFNIILPLSKLAQAATFLTCIQEVFSLNLNKDPKCPELLVFVLKSFQANTSTDPQI
jgi:hypothetical protein